MNSLLTTLSTSFYHVSSAPRRVTIHYLWRSRQLCCNLRVHILSFVWTFSNLTKVYWFSSILICPQTACSFYTYVGILRRTTPKFFALATLFSDLLQGQTCQSAIPISWNGSSLRDKPLRTLKDECMTPSLGWLIFTHLGSTHRICSIRWAGCVEEISHLDNFQHSIRRSSSSLSPTMRW